MHLTRVASLRALYDARASLPFDGHTNNDEVSQVVDLLCQFEPKLSVRICDIGCGGGWHLRELSRRGYSSLYGIDLSPKTLLAASRVCSNTSAIFFLQDISSSSRVEFFDVVTVFNATLGSGNEALDSSFVRGAASQLRPGGRFLLTYFPLELASAHVGQFSVAYGASKGTVVNSSVEFDSDKNELSISQRVGETALPSERLHLYSRSAMASLLADAGFVVERSSLTCEGPLATAGIGWIAATKRHG